MLVYPSVSVFVFVFLDSIGVLGLVVGDKTTHPTARTA